MKYLIGLLALVFSLDSRAGWNDWSELDRKLFIAHQVTIVADWATTRYGSKHRSQFPNTYETNIFLGKHPSVSKVDAYFVAYLIGNYYLADWLPPKYRTFYLTVGTINQANLVRRNIELGWKMSF